MNIYDISRKAGVSIATVSRVLNNSPHVSDNTRRRVLKVIESAGYVPNAFARGLGLNTMKTIGLLCPDATDLYLARALAELERAFRSHHYDCLLTCTGREPAARAEGVEMLRNRHVDGIVLMGSSFIGDTEAENAYIREAAAHVPLMLLNGAYDCENVYCVLCDDRRAMREAVEGLVQSGRRRILYLYNSANYSGQRKIEGYREGLAKCGIEADERLICRFDRSTSGVSAVRDALIALADSGVEFDAVLASEDILAIGAVKYARAKRLWIPKDLSIVGYNDSDLCLCSEPELTSVDNCLTPVCEQIVQTMMGVLEGRQMPQTTVFTAEMKRRGSSAM